jgi:CBS domain-containing protein
MNIDTLCQRGLVTIDAGESATAAANLMRNHHVGTVVVTQGEEPPRVLGVVTDRDLAIEVVARGLDPASVRIADLAQGALIDVPVGASMQEALEAMGRGGVRRLLVVDGDGGVAGIVSSDDLLGGISGELEALSRALRCGIGREVTQRGPVEAPAPAVRPVFAPQGMVAMQ